MTAPTSPNPNPQCHCPRRGLCRAAEHRPLGLRARTWLCVSSQAPREVHIARRAQVSSSQWITGVKSASSSHLTVSRWELSSGVMVLQPGATESNRMLRLMRQRAEQRWRAPGPLASSGSLRAARSLPGTLSATGVTSPSGASFGAARGVQRVQDGRGALLEARAGSRIVVTSLFTHHVRMTDHDPRS